MSNDFPAWGKTPRLGTLHMVVTEKIDGTNGLVQVEPLTKEAMCDARTPPATLVETPDGYFHVRAGSRNRWLVPGDKAGDNYGFARWVEMNAAELVKLGRGNHYGEWWGVGIGRGYDLTERRFSLFNTRCPAESLPACCAQVPLLYSGAASMEEPELMLQMLGREGSRAAAGYMRPEGVIVWLGPERYKLTFEPGPKGA